MLGQSANHRKALVGAFGVALAAAGVGVGERISEQYLFAWDNGAFACLPYRTFVIDRLDHRVEPGNLVSFRTFGMSAEIRPDAIFTKLVAGGPGDRVRIDEAGVFVNEAMIGPVFGDVAQRLGRSVESFYGEYVLEPGEFFLVGTEDSSFDSRFYGPVPKSQFVGQTYGVW